MKTLLTLVSLQAITLAGSLAMAQSPGVLYTWNGTGNIHDWATSSNNNQNVALLDNSTAGVLTVVETGDSDPFGADDGAALVIRDGFNRRMESSTAQGGLDLTGLQFVEIDLQHNGAGNINVQFFSQVTPNFTYTWAGSNGVRNGNDFTLAGNTPYTLQYPLSFLAPDEQAYIRTFGLSIRDHTTIGNVTWTISEMRSVGTPLTTRVLANHNVGSSDNGLQGMFANFDLLAIVGNDGQNQNGFTHDPSGPGSLKWTDKGGTGQAGSESGAAIGYGNGTVWDGNSFNERLTDFSNYTHVTYRMSATDPLNAGGNLGVQAYLQTGNSFTYQSAGDLTIPIDGQFYDITFPIGSLTDRKNIQFSGVNLAPHTNTLDIRIDEVRYTTITNPVLLGDYNENGAVDAADFTAWRDNLGANIALPNEGVSPGVVDAADYSFWVARFGATTPGSAIAAAIPEPATLWMLLSSTVLLSLHRRTA